MTDEQAQKAEWDARRLAHGCPVYAPGNAEPDSRYKATISGQRAAAAGNLWITCRRRLIERNLTPITYTQKGTT